MTRILFFISVQLIFCVSLFAQDCGVERWSIKSLSDADTVQINFSNIIPTTVHDQINIERPAGKIVKRDETEMTVLSMDCYILGFKKEKDKDFHIIVKDVNSEESMVIEIISSECSDVQKTSRFEQIKQVQEWFPENIGVPHNKFKMLDEPKLVTITGVGFWDFLHGQKGMAANGREIHPVLTMTLK